MVVETLMMHPMRERPEIDGRKSELLGNAANPMTCDIETPTTTEGVRG